MILASGTLKKAPMSLTIRADAARISAPCRKFCPPSFACIHFPPFPGSVSSVFPHSPVYADFPQSQTRPPLDFFPIGGRRFFSQ